MSRTLVAGVAAAVALAGCGGEKTGDSQPPPGQTRVEFERVLRESATVSAAGFPRPACRTLQELADTVRAGPQLVRASSVFTPGANRFAFGLLDRKQRLVYGKVAVYVADGPRSRARDPYPAPARPLVVEPPFRSRGAAQETDPIAAIYSARVPLPRPGRHSALVLVRLEDGSFGAGGAIDVKSASGIPAPGEPAPRVATDTLATAGGAVGSIDTRVPADDMHRRSSAEVVGRKPVALLFATPALCQSRVCGPVTDMALQLKARYGDRVEFIHQEVYIDNDPKLGLRRPLRAFGLRTEPWLFTVDRDGRVAARLEGSFGLDEFEQAVKAAL